MQSTLHSFVYAIVVIFTTSITGCVSQTPSDPARTIAALSDRVVIPGKRIGPLRLDGKVDEILKLLGSGTVRHPGIVKGVVRQELFALETWDAIGLWVQYDSATGNVIWISVDMSGPNAWAEHSTPEGIRLGMRQQDIISIMGTPERTMAGGGATSLYYDSLGIRFTVADVGTHAGKLVSLRVVWPSHPSGDMIIVPGVRISNIKIGMPIEQVVALLGGGFHRGEPTQEWFLYYWPHFGLSVEVRSGRVFSISTAKHQPSDAVRLHYSTEQGLTDGSAAAEVKRIYGDSHDTGPCIGWLCWTYRSQGINFALDDDSRIRFVVVFPPESLGLNYEKGYGIAKDDAEAVQRYQLAAAQGFADAQYYLGKLYAEGRGIAKDDAQAVQWYRRAAEQGHLNAQYALGVMYKKGWGVPQDDQKAVVWYRKAAERGLASAQNSMGFAYTNGQGVQQDYQAAVWWFQNAAKQGHVDAQFNLAVMYDTGRGVPKDYKEAADYYLKAAEQGHVDAQFNLGDMLRNGQGVPKDMVQADMWLSLAMKAGHGRAGKIKKLAEETMTSEQINQTQVLVQEWLAKHK